MCLTPPPCLVAALDVLLNDKVALQDAQVWGLAVAGRERLLARREVGLVVGGVVQDTYAHVFALLESPIVGPRPARRPDLTDQPSLLAANGQATDGSPDLGVVARNVRIAGIRYRERTLRVVGVSPRRLGVYPQPRRTELAPQLPFPVDLIQDRGGLWAATDDEDVFAVLVDAVEPVDVGRVGAQAAVDAVLVTVLGVHRVVAAA